MAEPAELTPAELEDIEDALEHLLDREAETDASSPVVRERLATYRCILQLSCDALPMQDAPAGALDAVIAQAHEATDTAIPLPLNTHRRARRRWWAQWQGLWVPGLAVAAAAVLVLVIVTPTSTLEGDAPSEVAIAPATPASIEAEPETPPSSVGGSPSPVRDEARSQGRARDAAPADALEEEPVADVSGTSDTPRWDLVARGDRARRAGDCKGASAEYAIALADQDARVRARAYAGLGLCDADAGRFKAATEHYARAKELDPKMAAYIEDERPRGSRGGAGKAAKTRRAAPKASAKSEPPPVSAFQE